MTRILGLSAYYHDSAAALAEDGKIISAVQEERFSRRKNDARFPRQSIQYCLKGITPGQIDQIVFYEKPFLTMERLLETYMYHAPFGFRQFRHAMPIWIKEKLFLKQRLKESLARTLGVNPQSLPPLGFTQHHQAHAASAYLAGPFRDAAVLCVDGVGEWATSSAWLGNAGSLKPLWQVNFPHSLGLLYSAFTWYCGFKVNSGEYKLMGLAPYGNPAHCDTIFKHLLTEDPDGRGGFTLNLDYFDFPTGDRMISDRFSALFGQPPRTPDSELTPFYMDIAASIQAVIEKVMLAMATRLQQETGARQLCLAGGVALNGVAAGKIRRAGSFDEVWVQPAAGDAGGAIGAALVGCQAQTELVFDPDGQDAMQGACLGPSYNRADIRELLETTGANYTEHNNESLLKMASRDLSGGLVLGWHQGRMEFGPRALGNRSILADPRNVTMQKHLNLKIKYRESFRPFAPAVLAADANIWFDCSGPSPFMGFVEPVRQGPEEKAEKHSLEALAMPRASLPAVTHVDFSARLQTVHEDTHPLFHRLLQQFKAQTGTGVLINTSFNVRGEPIVESPADALRCFLTTDMDCLAIGPFYLRKSEQAGTTAPKPARYTADQRPTLSPGKFGVQFGLLFAICFGIIVPFLLSTAFPAWPWSIALVLAAGGWLLPTTMARLQRGWIILGGWLNHVTSPLILGLVYFLVVTPIGRLKRRLGKSRYQPSISPQEVFQSPIQSQNLKDPF